MDKFQQSKYVELLPPELKNNGAFTGNAYVDTKQFSSLLVLFQVGASDADVGSGDAATPPLIEECDTSGGSYTAVSGAALSAVIGATDDDKVYGILVSLTKSHKRYMRVKAPTADNQSTGANLAILAILSGAAIGPVDAGGMGLEEFVTA